MRRFLEEAGKGLQSSVAPEVELEASKGLTEPPRDLRRAVTGVQPSGGALGRFGFPIRRAQRTSRARDPPLQQPNPVAETHVAATPAVRSHGSDRPATARSPSPCRRSTAGCPTRRFGTRASRLPGLESRVRSRDTPPGPPTSSKRGRAPDRRPGGRRRAAGTPGRRTAQGAVAAARRACSLCAPPQNRTGLRCRNREGRASWTDRGGTNESPFAQAPLGKCFQSTPIATRVPRARTANVRGPNGRRPGALDRRSVDVTRRPAGGGAI